MIIIKDRTSEVLHRFPTQEDRFAISPVEIVTNQIGRHLIDTILPDLIKNRSSVAFNGELEWAYLYPLYELASRVFDQSGNKKLEPGFVHKDFSDRSQMYSIIARICKLSVFKDQLTALTGQLIVTSPIFVSIIGDKKADNGSRTDLLTILASKDVKDLQTMKADLTKSVRKEPTEEEILAMQDSTAKLIDSLLIQVGRGRGVSLQPDEYPNRVKIINTIIMAIQALFNQSRVPVVTNLNSTSDYYRDAHALSFALAAYLTSTSSQDIYDANAPSYTITPTPQLMLQKLTDKALGYSAFYGGAAFAGKAATIKVFERFLRNLFTFFDPSLHPRLSQLKDAEVELKYGTDKLSATTLSAAAYHANEAFDFIQTMTGVSALLPPIVESLIDVPIVSIPTDPYIAKNWDGIILGHLKQKIVSAENLSGVAALLTQQTTIFRYAVEQLAEELTAISMADSDATSPNILNLSNELFVMKKVPPLEEGGILYTSMTEAYPLPVAIDRFVGKFGQNPWTLSGDTYVPLYLMSLWRKHRVTQPQMIFPGGYTLPIKVTNVYTYAYNMIPFCYVNKHVQDAPLRDIYSLLLSIPAEHRPEPSRLLEDLAYAIENAHDAIINPLHYAYAVAGMLAIQKIPKVKGNALTQVDLNIMSAEEKYEFVTELISDHPKLMSTHLVDGPTKLNVQSSKSLFSTRTVYGAPWGTVVAKQPQISDPWYSPKVTGLTRFHVVSAGDNYYIFRMLKYFPKVSDALRIPCLLEGRAYLQTFATKKFCAFSDKTKISGIWAEWEDKWAESVDKTDMPGLQDEEMWFDNPAFINIGTLYPHITYEVVRPLDEAMDDAALDKFLYSTIRRGLHQISNTLVVERSLRAQPIVLVEAADALEQSAFGAKDLVNPKPITPVVAPIKGSDAPVRTDPNIPVEVISPESALAGEPSQLGIPTSDSSPGVQALGIVTETGNLTTDPKNEDPSGKSMMGSPSNSPASEQEAEDNDMRPEKKKAKRDGK